MLYKHGAYKYEDYDYEATLGEREQRPAQELKNGSVYFGQWLVGTNIREGQGI